MLEYIMIPFTLQHNYFSHGLVNLLLVAVHLCEGPDLSQVHALSVAQGYDLIECKDQVKCIVQNILFIQRMTVLWDLTWEWGHGFMGMWL